MEAESTILYNQSNSHINKLLEDKTGYIWIATDNGLYRFDGNTFKTFTRNSESPALLSNMVLAVFEDSDNNIWVGSYDGIQKYNPLTETFDTPMLNYPGLTSLTYINSIIQDKEKNIWFSTSRSGVVCLTADALKPLNFNTTNSAICSDRINVIFEDKFGNIWIGTNDNGISMFNPFNHTFTHYSHNADDETTPSGNMIFSFAQSNDGELFIASVDGGVDSFNYRTHKFTRNRIPVGKNAFVLKNDEANNKLYIGTDGKGLYSYDFATSTLSHENPDVKDFDMLNAKIHDIIKDSNDNLWAGVYQHGLLYIPASSDKIDNYRFNPFNPSSNIGNNPVLAILKDKNNKLWIGTDGDGIYHTDNNGQFKHISSENLDSHIVEYLFESENGQIWASCYLGGLSRFNPASKRFEHINIYIDSKPVTDIMCITEDNDGNLWLGTNNNGVIVFDPETHKYKNLSHNNELPSDRSLAGNSVQTIFIDSNDMIWIGTSDSGISKYNPAEDIYEHYNLINRRINNNCIYAITEDRNGKIWVATALGVSSLPQDAYNVKTADSKEDMEPAYSMLLDDDGNIWYASNDGLRCVDPNNGKVIKVLSQSKVGNIEFKKGSSFIDNQGMLYFGGVGGMVAFLPDGITTTSKMHNIEFQYYSIEENHNENNETSLIPIGGKDELMLNYDENTFTITFTAFNFNGNESISYFSKLDNYNDNWIPVPEGSHSVTYSKLPAGKYNLWIRAQNDEGIFTEKNLLINIRPPFYLSWWAKCIVVLLGVIIIGLTYLWFRKINFRKAELLRKKQEDENTQDKLQFFTDISHEVRTPLTLIMSPIATLKKNTSDKKLLETYNIMETNGQRILRMLDQVIDLRKLDTKNTKLHLSPTDLLPFLEEISHAFSQSLEIHNINFHIRVSEEVPEKVILDRDKIEKVIFNLLSNAIRFTPDRGSVGIEADIDGSASLRIRIKDTGPGIEKEDQEKIFERFFQTKSGKKSGGTGIGLHLSKKMMDLHHGKVFVEESGPEGTVFTIILPLDKTLYESDEIEVNSFAIHENSSLPIIENNSPSPVNLASLNKSRTLLIVEDDKDILNYLYKILSTDYNIITTSDGMIALEMAIKRRPHCIITDIMIPGMDGLELCRKIRSNPNICTIPIIIISARANEKQKLEGIEAGADVYITKPFNIDILKAQIQRLIHSQRIFKQKLTNSEKINEVVAELKSADEKLLRKVEDVVVSELANPELNVEFISSKIGVSRSHLHRKLRELMKISPSLYIRQTRMRHAAILLIEKQMTISEVAYATGFNSLSHFSSSFKDFYSMSPSQYILLNSHSDNFKNIEDKSES